MSTRIKYFNQHSNFFLPNIGTVRAAIQGGSSNFQNDLLGGLVIEFSFGGLILERVLYSYEKKIFLCIL